MTTISLYGRIAAITADVLEVPAGEIKSDSSPETIHTWDSVHHLNLVLALEGEFGVQFEPEEIDQFKNVSEIVKITAAKTGLS